jgi:cyanobactin maturation PatA/PatG family protease
MDRAGRPLPSCNFGAGYAGRGVLAPGADLLAPAPGGYAAISGTSAAAAVVSGIAALLLSLAAARGRALTPLEVREALLASAAGRGAPLGRVNVTGATRRFLQGAETMSENTTTTGPQDLPAATPSSPGAPAAEQGVTASGCGCGGARPAPRQLVYAIGRIGYDFGSESRRDSLQQHAGVDLSVQVPQHLAAFLTARDGANRHLATSVIWTLNLDNTPIYALAPLGPFAERTYVALAEFFASQLQPGGPRRVSIPGLVVGSATLMSGQSVPVVAPELRGMHSWSTGPLAEAVIGAPPEEPGDRDEHQRKMGALRNFLDRIYYELRNLGATPEDRALNYAATNAFNAGRIFADAHRERLELDHIEAVPSPVCRPGQECYEVRLYFFYPERQVQTVRKVYRFTVDVSDIVPVTIGSIRSFYAR